MDAFFASVEVLDDPSLSGLPVIVGGSGSRGVVASCTYEARAYGIHSAMPSTQARRRCPHAVFVEGHYERYAQTSKLLHELLWSFTPLVEGIGLDEAFLDISGAVRLLGTPREIAENIRAAVLERLHLSCSVGVARTKLLAKLASRAAKPSASFQGSRPGAGVVVVEPEEEIAFLHPLPVRALWGIGPATAQRLASLGIDTVGELAEVPEDTLCRLVGSANGRHLAALARGFDDRGVRPDRETKSVGHEETLASDLHAHEDLHRHVLRMSDAVAVRLRESGLMGRTVTVKLRYKDRRTITRSQTLSMPTDSAHAISVVAGALLESVDVSVGIRLLGVTASSLARGEPRALQLSFEAGSVEGSGAGVSGPHSASGERGSPRYDGWTEVERVVSLIRERYGRSAVGPAALVGPGGIDVKRRGDRQWGPSETAGERLGS